MYNMFLDGLQLPVTPSEMTTRINNKNETLILMNEGEVNVLKKPGLTDIEFKALLPNVKYPFAVYPNGYQPASHFLDKFEQLKVSQKPFQLIVNRMLPNNKLLFDTNITMSLENYEIQESAENGFDILVAIKLKQYREYGTKRLKPISTQSVLSTSASQKVAVEKKRPTNGKTTPKTYTVKSGDTLWAICKKHLGDGAKYPEIAKLNNIKNPNRIYPGQVIKLG